MTLMYSTTDAGIAGAVTMAVLIALLGVIAEALGQRTDRRERDARRSLAREAWRAEYLVGDPVVEDALRVPLAGPRIAAGEVA